MNYYDVYVPVEGKVTNIAPGSAICGRPTEAALHDGTPLTEVYFEANLYNAVNMGEYEDMLYHAAGRMWAKYPTIATRLVPSNELVCVGTYCYETQTLDVEEPELLEAWKAKHWSKTGESNGEIWQRYRWGSQVG